MPGSLTLAQTPGGRFRGHPSKDGTYPNLTTLLIQGKDLKQQVGCRCHVEGKVGDKPGDGVS